MRLSFHRFFGLPRLRTPCGRLTLAIFARRLSSTLPTWASHSLLRASVHLFISWIALRCRRWSLRILSLSVFLCIALVVFISIVPMSLVGLIFYIKTVILLKPCSNWGFNSCCLRCVFVITAVTVTVAILYYARYFEEEFLLFLGQIYCIDDVIEWSHVKPSTPAGRRVQYKRDGSPTRPTAIPRDPSTSLCKPKSNTKSTPILKNRGLSQRRTLSS